MRFGPIALLLCALLNGVVVFGQSGVRIYSLDPEAEDSNLSDAIMLGNGDLLHFDRSWDFVARIDPQGVAVWAERIQLQGWPTGWLNVSHAAEQSNGDIALAVLQRGPNSLYHPGLVRLSAAGEILSTAIDTIGIFQAWDYLQVVALDDDGIRLFTRRFDGSGGFDAFTATGTHEFGLAFSEEDVVPIRATNTSDLIVGAHWRGLHAYDPDGMISWTVQPSTTTIDGVDHGTFIAEVLPVPGGFAFGFIRTGAPGLAPGIGLVSATGVFQQAVVFVGDELTGINTVFSNPRIAYTGSELVLVANNTDFSDPRGYLFACSLDLATASAWKVAGTWESFPNSVSATLAGDVVLAAKAFDLASGDRILARGADVQELGACFPVLPFSAVPFPMAVGPPEPIAGVPRNSTWIDATAMALSTSMTSQLLCGTQSVAVAGMHQPVLLYPVPATERLHVNWPDPGPIRVDVLDALGRVTMEAKVIDPTSGISVVDLANGVHWLRITEPDTGTWRLLPFVVE